jgi:hypothetical protein
MTRTLAPIGIITYSRVDHLRKTITSLQANALAKDSELYIFIDAPKQGDEEKVTIVTDYAYSVSGFKKIHIQKREINNRINNYLEGIGGLLKCYGKIIFLEDDNIVSPFFLKYMNDALNFYEYDKSILAISGYNLPIKFPKEYQHNYYLSKYFNAWGFATWSDRDHLSIEINKDAYKELMHDKTLKKLVFKYHPKLVNGLKRIHDGKILAGDYNLTYFCIKNSMYIIRPVISLVDNIGHDGSGLHCRESNKFNNKICLDDPFIIFSRELEYYKYLDELVYKYTYSRNIFTKELPGKILKKINNICSSRLYT